jgi:hypothetical protein
MPPPARHPTLPLLVLASIGAALVHAAVVPAHADWSAAAAFFAALAMFQLCWAVLLLVVPPTQGFLVLGIIVNADTVLLWLAARTIGMPFGPHQGETEAFARTDMLAAVLELAVVGAALWWVRARPAAGPTPRPRHARLTTGATGALVSVIAVVALSGASAHHHPAEGDVHGVHAAAHSGH